MNAELMKKIRKSIEDANKSGNNVSVDGILNEMANAGIVDKELIDVAGRMFEK